MVPLQSVEESQPQELVKEEGAQNGLVPSILARLNYQCLWITGLGGIMKLYKCLFYLFIYTDEWLCADTHLLCSSTCAEGTRGLSSPSWLWAAAPLPSHTEHVQWRSRSSGQAGLGRISHPGPQQWAVGPQTAAWQRPAPGLWRSVLPAKLGMTLQRLEWALQSQFTGHPGITHHEKITNKQDIVSTTTDLQFFCCRNCFRIKFGSFY